MITVAYCSRCLQLSPGGAAALRSLIDGFSVELATLLFVSTISVYTLMGGLGAAFYVSYFNTGAIMILIVVFLVKVFFDNSEAGKNILGLDTYIRNVMFDCLSFIWYLNNHFALNLDSPKDAYKCLQFLMSLTP